MSKFKKAILVFLFICGVSYTNPNNSFYGGASGITREFLAVGCSQTLGPCEL